MSESSVAWQPSATFAILRKRARLMQQIRDFFIERGYWEVETPIIGKFGITDVYLRNMHVKIRDQQYALQTSPEYHMKRMLAAGSGPIFQLARVFRDDELGRWHNPEFTLLEWYQLNIDHHQLMTEVDEFLQSILKTAPLKKITYREAFLLACNVDPIEASIADLRCVLSDYALQEVLSPNEQDKDQFLFLLMSFVVEPYFAKELSPIAIYDFPTSQASLAQSDGVVASRFEVYYQGVELANGFYELTDASTQRARFLVDNAQRQAQGLSPALIDDYLLQALEAGLPPCSGIALGVDRLLALCFKCSGIADCLAFDFSRA